MSGQQPTNSVEDISDILRTKYAIFTGGHDLEFRSLITFPDVGVDTLSDDAVSLLMRYFSSLTPCLAANRKCAAVIDRRGSDWISVRSVLKNLMAAANIIDHVYILKPQGFFQKLFIEKTINKIRAEFRFSMSFADTAKELSSFIDPEHLPSETGGLMAFDIENWIRDRSKIEAFRQHVQLLCQREEELRLGFGKQSLALSESTTDAPVHVLNPAYLPPVFDQNKRLRRQWLDAVSDCEATGLQLRDNLLDRTSESHAGASSDHKSVIRRPGECLPSCGSAANVSRSAAFELPVDRVFQDIHLTHILLKLTEVRTRFNQHWRQVIKRAKTAKLLWEVECRFHELRPFSDLWGNLLESAADYQSISRNLDGSTPPLPLPTPGGEKQPPSEEELFSTATCPEEQEAQLDVRSASAEFTATAGPEGLEAVVSRLAEAEQLASRLIPDLERLARTTDWLLAYVPQCNRPGCKDLQASEDSSVTSPAALRPSFHWESSGSDSNDPPVSPGGAASSLTSGLPALRLPAKASADWPVLFNRLLTLARVELPRAVDQLNLLVQLHSEINNARTWCARGRGLVDALQRSSSQDEQTGNAKSLSLNECQARLAELIAFHASKEATLELLTDPRLFRLKFSSIMNTELRSILQDLLCSVEEVETSCQTKAAELRQQISRLSFPRQRPYTSSSSAPTLLPPVNSGSVEVARKAAPSKSASAAGRTPPASTAPSVDASSATPDGQPNSATVSPARRYQLAWEEFVETERNYVNFLHHVYRVIWPVTNAKDAVAADDQPEAPVSPTPPPFMRDHPSWLLVNWPDLVTFHQDFLLPLLEACSGNGMKLKQWAVQVAPRLTDLYSVYCSLHDSAVQVACHLEKDRVHSGWISDCNEEVHRRETQSPLFPIPSASVVPTYHVPGGAPRPSLPFSSRLVTPVQRFQRYHLLLNRLVEMALTESSREDLKEAHKSMLEMCEIVNLAMRFYGLSTRPSELGRLLLRADFSVSRSDTKAMSNQQCHVFLFTNTVLLTKFRLPPSTTSPVLPLLNAAVASGSGSGSAAGGGASLPGSGDLSDSTPVRTHSNQSLSSLPLHPSNLIALAKSHVIGSSGGGSNNSLPGAGISSSDSRPVYEIREELPLAQIGLTPSVRADRRRFAIWTANRAQTYVFQSSDPSLREKWVGSINDLLMGQLRRLRDETLRRYLPQSAHAAAAAAGGPSVVAAGAGFTPTRIGCITGVSPATTAQALSISARSSSLPIPSDTVVNRTTSDNVSILSLPLEQHSKDR